MVKTSLVSGLSDGEVAFGSTEFIVLAAKSLSTIVIIFIISRLENSVHCSIRMEELLDDNALHGNH